MNYTKNILITGLPGVGKTALVKKLAEIFKEFNPVGFYTEDIKENGIKTGYNAVSLYGDSIVLAHITFKSKHRVGKYKVNMKGFETFLTDVFMRDKKKGLYIIDEIGKIECKSKKFGKLIDELLDSELPVIASIPDKGTGAISDIKKRDDIKLIDLLPENKEQIQKTLTMELRDILLE